MRGVHRDLYRPRCGGIYGKEAEKVRTRNERRQRRQERFWTGMVILFGCLVFCLGAAVGIQVAGL